MTARSYLGRRKLAALALALAAVLSLGSAGAVEAQQASTAAAVVPCGVQATGNGPELITAWRYTGCTYIGYAWVNTVVAVSPDGWSVAQFQTDGNLVVYNGPTPIWASNTYAPTGSIYFTYDGNMSVKANPSISSVNLWSSSNYFGAYGTMRMIMWNGGHLVIYNGNWKPYWSSFYGRYTS